MEYILTTIEKNKYRISEEIKNQIMEAVNNNEKYVVVNGDTIPLHIIPAIVNVPKWIEDMDDSLRHKSKRICKKCMRTREIEGFCECRDSGKLGELACPSNVERQKLSTNQKLLA
jgi:uncharacterized protein (UPF0248 family)